MSTSQLIKAVRNRHKGGSLGYGITTADRYVKQLADSLGVGGAAALLQKDIGTAVREAKRRLVYCNEDMICEEKTTNTSVFADVLPKGIEIPQHTAMLIKHTITTPREDRDTDILHTDGAVLDPKAPLLWQHMPALPIGKHLVKTVHTEKKLAGWSALLDLNDLTSDAIKLVEADVLRFSHGFRVISYKDRKDGEGFEILKFEIMEVSLVSVPSNVDAEVELYSRGALKSDVMKAHAKYVNGQRRKSYRGVGAPGSTIRLKMGDYEATVRTHEGAAAAVAAMERLHRQEPAKAAGAAQEPIVPQEAAQPPESKGVKVPEETLRWNKSWSAENFDVPMQHLEPSRLEYDWVSRYVGTEIKNVHKMNDLASGAECANYLQKLERTLSEAELVDIRNITTDGKEVPPVYEKMQLNSREASDFLIEGLAFYKFEGKPLAVKREPCWAGIELTYYCRRMDRPWLDDHIEKIYQAMVADNPMKGEAFTLSGEFLDRGNGQWEDVLLSPKNEGALRRATQRLADEGKAMPTRGMMMLGPPGCGKTVTARVCLNKTAPATFIWITARDVYRMGTFGAFSQGFKLAKNLAPTMLFFEDIDTWLSSGTVDFLKNEMDGLVQMKGVLTVMSTNHPESLPDALIDRPGRFHDVLEFGLPDKAVRMAMIEKWMPGVSTEGAAKAADETDGDSGAHIYELCAFAKSLQQEGATPDDAIQKAVVKVREQRDLIQSKRDEVYRPRKDFEATIIAGREKYFDRPEEPAMMLFRIKRSEAHKKGEPLPETKAGKVLSAKNMAALQNCYDDMAEMSGMELPRTASALCERCMNTLKDVMDSATPVEDTAKETTPQNGQLAKQLCQLPEGELQRVISAGQAFLQVTAEQRREAELLGRKAT